VRAVHDFGAGDVIEVAGETELMLPFTRTAVPTVDLPAGRLVADLGEIGGE
jgi:16S rRNA processing protein RimM